MSNFKFSVQTLSSGLRTVLIPYRQVETVTFLILVGVGSRYETPRQAGLSHFLEHMFFKGTSKRPDKREIAEALDNVGAEFNAFTGEEVTGYYVKVPKKHLRLAADVVTDILQHSLFPEEEIEQERGVIVEEIRMYTDNPMAHVHHLWNEALFGNHPLGRRIDGKPETVGAFKRRDFLSYTKQHYHTQNAVVAVAGNFSEPTVMREVERLMQDLAKGKETSAKVAPKKMPAHKFIREFRPTLDQTHLMVGVPGVSVQDERRWATELLAIILGGGMSSRLFFEVREKRGLAYAVRTRLESFVDTGSLVTQAGLRSDKTKIALEIILHEYDRVMQEKVGVDELKKAKEMMRGQLVLGLEETNSMAMFVAAQSLLEKEILNPEEILERVEAVTAEELQTVAQELFVPSRRAAVLLGPQRSSRIFERVLES